MFSFLRGLADKHRLGREVQEKAWEAYRRSLHEQGILVHSREAPNDGESFWVYLTDWGAVCFEQVRAVVRAVESRNPSVQPRDQLRRPVPFKTCSLVFDWSSQRYGGLEVPNDLESLIRGHPYEPEIRALRRGEIKSIERHFRGVETGSTPVYAVGEEPFELFTELKAAQESIRQGGQIRVCGHVLHPTWVIPAGRGFVYGTGEHAFFVLEDLILDPVGSLTRSIGRGYAQFKPAEDWMELFAADDDVLVRRFSFIG